MVKVWVSDFIGNVHNVHYYYYSAQLSLTKYYELGDCFIAFYINLSGLYDE